MQIRENALHQWLKTLYPDSNYTLTPLAGDASFRRYYRFQQHHTTKIIMDAPPEKLSLRPFVSIGKLLLDQGLTTPQIFAVNHDEGFALLEDFGSILFSEALQQMKADHLYPQAVSVLQQMQSSRNLDELTVFDQKFMLQELSLFPDWFLQRYLGITLTQTEEQLLKDTFQYLTNKIAQQPQVFIHRDYHSRNIMLLNSDQKTFKLGIIDFQDAMIGPITYDLVSLLKDCYIQLPPEQLNLWLQYFYDQSSLAQTFTFPQFRQAFDWCGLQRHLRILGTFCRLHLRDGKSNYLNDLPLTYQYVISCLMAYPEFRHFGQWLQEKVHSYFLSTSS